MELALPLALLAGSYLIGSIPFSYLIVRRMSGLDLRSHGSGNVGATNVLRTSGKGPGIAALVLDILKGWGVTMGAFWIAGLPLWPYPIGNSADPLRSASFWVGAASLLAVLGHMFPVWLRFRGGKGVATAAGVFLALDVVVSGCAIILFALVVILSRYVSLASTVAAASVPLLLRFGGQATFWTLIFSTLIALAVILKHHQNISRLVEGTERKLGQSKESK